MPRTSSTPKASSSGSSDVGDMSLVITQRSADLTHPDLIRGPASRARPSRHSRVAPALWHSARSEPAGACSSRAPATCRRVRCWRHGRRKGREAEHAAPQLARAFFQKYTATASRTGSGPPKIDARILEPRHLAAAPHDAKPVGVSRPIAPEHPTARGASLAHSCRARGCVTACIRGRV